MAQVSEWVSVRTVVPKSWKPKLEEIAEKKGYRTTAEFLRDVIREIIEDEEDGEL